MDRGTWKAVLLALLLVSTPFSLQPVWAKGDNGQHKGQDKGKVSGKGHDKDGDKGGKGKGHGKDDDKKAQGKDSDLLACSVVFPDAASSNSNGGEIKFKWATKVINSPDNILDTKGLRDESGRDIKSCHLANCSGSGSAAPAVDYNDFPNNNNDVVVGYNQSRTLYPGDYKKIRLDSNARVTFKPGLYRVRESLSLGSSAQLKVEGDGVVRIMLKGGLSTSSHSRINVDGQARQLLIYSRDKISIASDASANGFFYAKGDLKLSNKAHVQGAVSGKKVELKSSGSKVTYRAAEAAAANFSGFCGTGSEPPPPPPPPSGGSCKAIWPDALQSHDASGQVSFGWHSRAFYSPDNRIETVKIVDNSGGTSCNDRSCTATFSPAEKLDFDGFKSSGGVNIDIGYNRSGEIGSGIYRNISLGSKATLTLKESGDYYLSGNFEAAWDARIVVASGKKARLFISGNFKAKGFVKGNRYGDPEQLLIVTQGNTTLQGLDQFRAVIYSGGNVTLGSAITLKGAVSGKKVELASEAYVLYFPDSVSNLGDICESGGSEKLSSLRIDVSDGVTCEASTVKITALDVDGQAYIPSAGTQVNLSSAVPAGQWSLASGAFSAISSVQFDGSSSELNLRFLPGGEGSSTLNAVAASDATVKGSATADFSNAALKFYYDNETEIIPTQIAGKVAGFKLRAIATDEKTGVCVAAASGDQDVTFTQSCVDPASCQTGATIGGKTFAANGSATAKLNFKDGWADFSYQYADAGKVKLTASMLTGAGIAPVKGESNSFISKPAGLCLKAVDAQAACSDATKLASCSAFKQAGKAFSIELSGRAWGTDKDTDSAYCDNGITPNFKLADIKLDHQLVAPTGDGTSVGTLSVGSNNKLSITTAGKVAVANTTVSEVGVFKLQAVPPAYMGQPLTETMSDNIGRFTPAYFTQDDDKSFIDPVCSNFSYIGQPFDLNLSLVPRNSAGAEVKNYQGIFQRMAGGTVHYGAIDGETDLSSRVPSDLTLQDKYISGNLIFPPFDLDRADTPDGPFDTLNISLGFTDADAVPLESGEVDGVGDSVSLGTTVVRFGVMRIASNSGVADASTPLDLGISVEYYNGSGYTLVPKADEGNCSKVTATDVSVSVEGDDSSYSLDAISLGKGTTAGSLHGDVNDSDADPHKLQFSAPGEGNTGTINVTLDVGDWLYGEDGSKPAATAEFTEQAKKGKVNDRVIYWLSN